MEGFAKTVEIKVTQNVKMNIDEKFKGLKKDIDGDVSKLNRQIKETEKDLTRVKETLMPTMQERLGDELDELRNKVVHTQKDLQDIDTARDSNKHDNGYRGSEENRYRNIIVRYLPEREDENVRNRVNDIIQDSLKLKGISVITAERKTTKHPSKPGVILATMDSYESKQSVMKYKID